MLASVRIYSNDLPINTSRQLRKAKVVACDIETSGLDWRSDVIGMCQFYTPEFGTALVKISPGCQPPLGIKSLIEDPHTTKVFHHAPFDLRFLRYSWGIRARSVACTKVASKMAFPEKGHESHSLRSLLKVHLGISLDKTEQASNWLAPTLTQKQLSYASNDVRHLIDLRECLEEKIARLGLKSLYEDCLTFLPSHVELQVQGRDEIFAY
jgi:ribonuclease D